MQASKRPQINYGNKKYIEMWQLTVMQRQKLNIIDFD